MNSDTRRGVLVGSRLHYIHSGEPDLTTRQMAVVMLVNWTPGYNTVRGLAAALKVTKPVITRALNAMGELGFTKRVKDPTDRRNVFISGTADGLAFLERVFQA